MNFEGLMTTEEKSENVIENKSHLFESTKKRLEEFMNLPDDPGMPYETQLKLREISERTKNPADIENYKKSKESKYRANALATPLTMVQAFLTRAPEAESIDNNKKTELLERIKGVSKQIQAKSASQLISKESVDEVIDIVQKTLDIINNKELVRN